MNPLPAWLLAVAALAGTEAAPPRDADAAFALRGALTRLTPEPQRVSAQLAQMCAMAPPPGAAAGADSAGPHAGARVNYYVSAGGEAAMAAADAPFPVGTIVLKEKLAGDSDVADAVGGMRKRAPGFDPDNGDWEYFYAARDGTFARGRLPNCSGCHARARAADFVFTRGGGADPRRPPDGD